MTRYSLILVLAAVSVAACASKGDNSDFDFGDHFDDPGTDIYADGYGRVPGTVRLATYNVHRCTPPNDNVNADYDGLGKAFRMMSPDVVAIQELDSCTTRHAYFQLGDLATRAQMSYTYCTTVTYAKGKYGIGILYNSALKVVRQDHIALPGEEPRQALITEFEDFVFIATHFCHKSDENRTEDIRLVTEYAAAHYTGLPKPVFLAGDLNEYVLTTAMGQALTASWTSLGVNTGTYFNTSNPRRIDYVLLWKGNGATVEVAGTAIPAYEGVNFNFLSDHYPVIVDLKPFGK